MDDRALPITDHLTELRRRIGWTVGAVFIGAVASFNFAEQIFGFLLAPATEALGAKNSQLQAIAPTEIFFTYIKCAVLSGFVLSLPVSFWQLWSFIAPGLYDSERRAILPFVICSTGLFAGGAIFGYSVVFPIVFQFFNSWDNEWVVSAWTMKEVFSLTTRLFLAFGIAFELPLFVFFLAITGIVSAKQLFKGTPTVCCARTSMRVGTGARISSALARRGHLGQRSVGDWPPRRCRNKGRTIGWAATRSRNHASRDCRTTARPMDVQSRVVAARAASHGTPLLH